VTPTARRPVRIALDLLGGDAGPEVVVDAALGWDDPSAELLLVGPVDLAGRLLAERGGTDRFTLVPAASAVAMDEDPIAAVRHRPDCSVRVATAMVRSGTADAAVSIGHTGASLAAAVFGLDRLPGLVRPAVAVIVPTLDGDVVLLDAGGTPDATPDLLAQFALAGTAYAQARGVASPRVGLLTIGTEAGKGDALRRGAATLLEGLPIDYVGGVEGGVLARGGAADVVVTDGFTGNVVLKAVEGAAEASLERAAAAYDDDAPARAVARRLRAGAHAGAVLLGVDGVCVVGHGASTPDEVAAYVRLAVSTVVDEILPRTARRLDELVAARRAQVPTLSGSSWGVDA
jgi:glycerol-3-phosphate acyltransferase PlsX